jgi:hypothetical protein
MINKRRRLSLKTATLSWGLGWAVVAMIALKQIPEWSEGGLKTNSGRWGSAAASILQEDAFSQQPNGAEKTLAARGEMQTWPALQPTAINQRAWQDQPAPTFSLQRGSWQYLPTSLREKIEQAPSALGRWKKIIITCTGENQGSARSLHQRDRDVLGADDGLRWHFVIGNGRGDAAGEVSVAPRWQAQQAAGSVTSDAETIVIALIGDWSRRAPSDEQLAALSELIPFLHLHTGWIKVELDPVQAGGKFPVTWLSEAFARKLTPRYETADDPLSEAERNLQ